MAQHAIETMPLESLRAAPYNPRVISDRALAGLGESIKRFGLVEPIVWNKRTGNVVGGHQRLRVLRAQGESEASVVVVDLPVSEERALNVALNSPSIAGDWTDDLDRLLDEIRGDTPDLYDDLLLDDLRSETKASVVEDEAPEAQAQAISKPGDLWLLGDHRVLCGDSTGAGDVERVMGGEKADMMFADPPYGVDYEGGHFNPNRKNMAGDNNTDIYAAFLPVAFAVVDGPCYMWFADSKGRDVYAAVCEASGEIHALLIWHKTNATYAAMNAQYKQRHEPCLYFKPKGSTLRWCGPSDECTLWEIPRDPSNDMHPTQKPVALPARAMGNHKADLIFDPFLGSGTTLIAAEQLGRKCYGIEIEPRYVDVIVRRWEKLTGKAATLDGDGRTFADASTQRSSADA